MNELIDLHTGQWTLLVLLPSQLELFLTGVADLAYRGPVAILDCGRQYDPTIVSCALEGQVEIADRIKTRHAFICSEAVRLLQTTPTSKTPLLVLDLLSTFYDENVQLRMRQFLLENAIQHLNRLSRRAGVGVIVYPPPSSSDSSQLFERLKFSAPKVITYDVPPPSFQQGSMF